MPIFSPYFPLESNAYRVGKSGQLRRRMGSSGFGIYVMLLSVLRDSPDCTARLDYDSLAYELHEDPAAVRRVVDDFDLFLIDRERGTFTAESLQIVTAASSPRKITRRNAEERPHRVRKTTRQAAELDFTPSETEEEDAMLDASGEHLPENDSEGESSLLEGESTISETEKNRSAGESNLPESESSPAEGESSPAEGAKSETIGANEGEKSGRPGAEGEADDENGGTEQHGAALDVDKTADTEMSDGQTLSKNFQTAPERKEKNKRPSPPIVPLPQGVRGKGETPRIARKEEGSESCFSAAAVSVQKVETATPGAVTTTASENSATFNADSATPGADTTTTRADTTSVPRTSGIALAPLSATSDNAPANGSESTPGPMKSGKNDDESPATAGKRNENRGEEGEADTAPPEKGRKADETEGEDESRQRKRRCHGMRVRFVAPNAAEVAAYVQSLGRDNFDARQFVLYYAARGWVLQGGLAVADWRSLVQLWMARDDARRRAAGDGTHASFGSPQGRHFASKAPKRPISSTNEGETPHSATGGCGERRGSVVGAAQQQRADDLLRMAMEVMGEDSAAPSADRLSFSSPSPQLPAPSAAPAAPSPAATQEEFAEKLDGSPSDNTHLTENENLAAKNVSETDEIFARETHYTPIQKSNVHDPRIESLSPTGNVLDRRSAVHSDHRVGQSLSLADVASECSDAAARREYAAELHESTLALLDYRAGCAAF